MGQAIDRAAEGDHFGLSMDYLLFLLQAGGVFLCGSFASWVRVYCLGTSTDSIASRLRRQLFNGYMRKNMEFYDHAKAGEVVSVLQKDVDTTASMLTDKMASGIRSLNSSLNGSLLLFGISPKLCVVALGLSY